MLRSRNSHQFVFSGSDIIFLDLPTQPTLVLNSFKAATDLMEKRSSIYSDKPAAVMDELYVQLVRFGFLGVAQRRLSELDGSGMWVSCPTAKDGAVLDGRSKSISDNKQCHNIIRYRPGRCKPSSGAQLHLPNAESP